jgi:glycosyltransferase involved in cell wall biosynthesis
LTILQLTSHLDVGGIPTYVVTLSEALARRGHEVIVAAAPGAMDARLDAANIEHWPLDLRTSAEFGPQAWRAWRGLARRLDGERVDVIHAHTRVAQVIADRCWRARGLPYVTTWHGFYQRRLSRALWPCTGLRTIAISLPVQTHLIRNFHLGPERLRLIPNGVDGARFARPPEAASLEAFRRQWRLEPGVPVVGTICRLAADKSVSLVIDALPLLKQRVPTVVLLITGDGPDRERLEALAASLGVRDDVRFVGSVDDTRVPLALMQAFVFTPATKEGFGLSLLEAMAAGVPVVGLRQGVGGAWALESSQAAELVEPGRPEPLAEAITRVLTDPVLAGVLRERARATVAERYDIRRVAEQVEAVYDECLLKP